MKVIEMKIDPRRLAAIEVQLDALALEAAANDIEAVDKALAEAQASLQKAQHVLETYNLNLQVPHDYKPPRGIGTSAKAR